MTRLKYLHWLLWVYFVLKPAVFFESRLHDLLWYFSDAKMQERYWAYRERKATKKKDKK